MAQNDPPRLLRRLSLFCLLLAGGVIFALASGRGQAPAADPAATHARPPARAVDGLLPRAAGDLVVVWWNVENLFDADDDPANPGDDEYTPGSWRRWTPELYQLKLQRLADVLTDLDGDVIGLAEVENRRVLEDLANALQRRLGRPYPFITHRDGGDERGIDVAVLSRIEPDRYEWLTPVPRQRDVLAADFVVGGSRLTLVANHWKSRWDGVEKTDPIRRVEAAAVGACIDRLLARDPLAAVLVTGDFNDDINGPAVAGELRSSTNRADVVSGRARLYSLQSELPPDRRGTIYYRAGRTWNTFDSANVTRAMVTGERAGGWRVRAGGFSVYRAERLLTPEGTPRSFRRFKNRQTGRWEYQTGYSDHLPLRIVLTRR